MWTTYETKPTSQMSLQKNENIYFTHQRLKVYKHEKNV